MEQDGKKEKQAKDSVLWEKFSMKNIFFLLSYTSLSTYFTYLKIKIVLQMFFHIIHKKSHKEDQYMEYTTAELFWWGGQGDSGVLSFQQDFPTCHQNLAEVAHEASA